MKKNLCMILVAVLMVLTGCGRQVSNTSAESVPMITFVPVKYVPVDVMELTGDIDGIVFAGDIIFNGMTADVKIILGEDDADKEAISESFKCELDQETYDRMQVVYDAATMVKFPDEGHMTAEDVMNLQDGLKLSIISSLLSYKLGEMTAGNQSLEEAYDEAMVFYDRSRVDIKLSI